MSTSDFPSISSAFEFGSNPSNESIHSFTFTSDRPRSTAMSGYLDDNPSASSSSNRQPDTLAPTSLFATLAQRQMDQQQHLSQSQYDDDAEWTSRSQRHPRSSKRHRRSNRYASESESEEEEDGSSDYTDDSSHDRALQQEWEDQLDQLKLMFQIIIFPFVGKFFGRKFGYFRKF
ncbi:Chromatin elongation factor SPT6 [Pseudozyma hubeiensis]|nr:Chromatin elongation factor SPT6 [Pseudozyma hubeiensis]